MKHPLLSLALTCLYLLHASAIVSVQPDFDITKFAGKWNLIALAMKEGQPSEDNRVHTTVVIDNDGVIAFKTRVPVGKECKRLQTRFFPDEQPGIYRTDAGKTTIYIMKTDYVHYAIIFVYTKEMEVLQLYVREEEASTEVIEIYKEIAASINLSVDKIIYLQGSDSCADVGVRHLNLELCVRLQR